MCGIVAYINKKEKVSEQLLKGITQTLKHRGPDATHIYIHNNLGIGHNRLSIINDDENSNQPFCSKCGRYVLSFNGEIYNYKELISEYLPTIQFQTSSDTEVLMHLIIQFGVSILDKINGIFSFIFFDNHQNELLVARDFFGVKPMYFYHFGDEYVFASEMRALKYLPAFNAEINNNILHQYTKFGFSIGDITPFKHINKIPPGGYLKFNLLDFKTQKGTFSIYKNKSKVNNSSLSELTNQLDKLLNNAIVSQTAQNQKNGLFLSGGLDSSLLAALFKKNNLTDNLNYYTTYTSFADYEKFGFESDFKFSEIVANHLDINLTVVNPSFNSFNPLELSKKLEYPLCDGAVFYTDILAKKAHNDGVKVLYSGMGADELFAGYRRHKIATIKKIIQPLLFLLPLFKKIENKNKTYERFLRVLLICNGTEDEVLTKCFLKYEALKSTINTADDFNLILSEANLLGVKTFLDKMLFLDQKTYLVNNNLTYLDKITMQYGIEARVPYLDNDIATFTREIDDKYKLKGFTSKFILKEVAKNYLPKEIIYRSKTGFSNPKIQELINNSDNSILF